MSFYNLPRFHAFRFWCQKVLPLVYDDSLSYVEVLYKVVHYLNKEADAINEIGDILEGHGIDINQAVAMVIQYLEDNNIIEDEVADAIEAAIENGDIDERCQFVVNKMVSDGDLDSYINGLISTFTTDNITPILDNTVIEYNTFADIPTSGLALGTILRTKGFYTRNDGGEGTYQVFSKAADMYPTNGASSNEGYSFKILDGVTAKKCGARGDGVTSDSSIIQEILNHYKEIDLQGYTYLITSKLTVSQINTKLKGNYATLQRANSNNVIILESSNVSRLRLDGIIFDGGTQTDLSMMVSITGGANIHIYNCIFRNSHGYCLRFSGNTNSKIEKTFFAHVTGGDGNPGGGVYMQGGRQIIFDSLYGDDLRDHLIYLDGSVIVTDVEISNCIGKNFDVQGAGTNGAVIAIYGEVSRCNIVNCSFYNVKSGIMIATRNPAAGTSGTLNIGKCISISNVTMRTIDEQGIMFSGDTNSMPYTQELVISNCSLFDIGQDGIDLRYCNMANITGCNVQSATRNGIAISNSNGVVVTGCSVGNCASGIIVGYTGESISCLIGNCVAYKCDQGIYLRLGRNHVVNGCKFYGTFTDFAYRAVTDNTVSVNLSNEYNGERSIIWGSSAPSSGTYRAGDICFDNTGATLGWHCTTGGSPGTWAAITA